MPDRIEPPILISRLMTFVFAGALVIVVTMIVTLARMFPLNRPQVFFLTTTPRSNLQVQLTELPPNDEYLDYYKRTFIREYIRARNEIVPNTDIMHRKWDNGDDGIVHAWSVPSVFADFTQTGLWVAMMNEIPDFVLNCPVEFENNAIEPVARDTYAVKFSYFCENSDGQIDKKDYKIRIRLTTENDGATRWVDRLNNPLGIRVAEYVVESGDSDPLDRFSI